MSIHLSRPFRTTPINSGIANMMRRARAQNSLSAGATAGRPWDLSIRDRAPAAILQEHPTDIKRLATSSSPRVERVQQVQRRCPWARAMIASPYIRQLHYGLPLCCIHGQSRGKDGAHLHNGRLARPNLRWFSAATHPTRPTPTRRSVGTVCLRPRFHSRVEDRALRHQAKLDVAPEGNGELSRDSNDHDFPHTLALARSALNEPSGECTLRLMLDPQPCGLNHNGTRVAAACSRNPLAALLVTTVVGTWSKAQKASHLPLVGELAVINLTRKEGGDRWPNALELRQQVTLALGCLAGRRRRVTLAFNLGNLLLHRGKPPDLPCNLAGESWRQPVTISGYELVDS